jgi:hypothetical protein
MEAVSECSLIAYAHRSTVSSVMEHVGGRGTNPGLTRYFLRLPRSKLKILVGLITGHCPINKHLHNMGLTDEPICIACEMEDESAFHLRVRTSSKPILGV